MADPSAEWFVYEHTVEGLFHRALRTRLTPAIQGRLKALGIDVNARARSVPHEQWKKAIHLAASELFEGSPDERFRQLGRTVMLRHDETVMGKAVIAVMKLMGPRRVLGRLNSTLRSGNNYIQANLAPRGPTSWEGTVNECNGNPHYIAGVVEQGLIISGGVNVKVGVSDFDGHSAKFLITWG